MAKHKAFVGGKPVYEIDLVAQRDRREKLKRDLIKSYNVNYIDAETLRRQEEERKQQEALEIFNRLESEKAADEAKKQEEIQQALQAQAQQRSQINDILGAKDEEFLQMLNEIKE